MDTKLVKDLMLPLDHYAVVDQEATLLDALKALEAAQMNLPPGRHRHRGVLIRDKAGRIVGKIGQLAFLKALEPKYNVLGDLGTLARAGVNAEFISSMMDHYQFFQDNFTDLCPRACRIGVSEVMHPVTENIDENASLREAIHRIVMLQTLSILVMRNGQVVGLLRLSDLFDEVAREMKAQAEGP